MRLIDQATVNNAMESKRQQLIEYQRSLWGRDDAAGVHARAVAEGRLIQLEQDMSLVALQTPV